VRILLTGASGFLGARVLPALAPDHDVHAVRRPGASGEAPQSERVRRVEWDLAAAPPAGTLPAPLEAVVHLAQSRRYHEFPEGARDVFAVNVASTSALLDHAVHARAAQFVLASTGSVYEPYTGPLRESAAVAPTSHYAASKLAAEMLVRAYGARMRPCVLRLFSLYGPGQEGRLMATLARRVASGEPVRLPAAGDGMVLSPTHVDDVVHVLRVLLAEGWEGLLNVAAPAALSIREVAEILGEHLGRAPRFARDADLAAPTVVPDLSCLAERYDLARLRPFPEGVRDVVASLRECAVAAHGAGDGMSTDTKHTKDHEG